MGMSNEGPDPQDARYTIFICRDCGYRLPYPATNPFAPRCPRCAVLRMPCPKS